MNARFIDTSVMLNILDVPGRNADREDILAEFKVIDSSRESLYIPLPTIIETGNHIAHINDDRARRACADKFAKMLNALSDEEAPWKLYGYELKPNDIKEIANQFINSATAKTGIGDLCIVYFYEKYINNTSALGKVMIWSTDRHLMGYSQDLTGTIRRKDR